LVVYRNLGGCRQEGGSHKGRYVTIRERTKDKGDKEEGKHHWMPRCWEE
jgi:hypothetical protein